MYIECSALEYNNINSSLRMQNILSLFLSSEESALINANVYFLSTATMQIDAVVKMYGRKGIKKLLP